MAKKKKIEFKLVDNSNQKQCVTLACVDLRLTFSFTIAELVEHFGTTDTTELGSELTFNQIRLLSDCVDCDPALAKLIFIRFCNTVDTVVNRPLTEGSSRAVVKTPSTNSIQPPPPAPRPRKFCRT